MSTVVDRDENMQVAFGRYLEEFAELMREQCNNTIGHIDNARDNVKDDAPSDAMDYVEATIRTILSTLPGIAEFGTDQIKKGRTIILAKDVFKKK